MEPIVDPAIEAYAVAHSSPEVDHLTSLAEATRASTSAPQMMVGPLEGGFLATLVAVTGAQQVLEVGTFTGYSALSMAAALGSGGRIVTCEIDPKHAELAQAHIDASPYGDRIEIHLGPATETIASLPGPFDLVFIDADKEGYADYYRAVLPMLAERGLIVVDNVLWSGRVLSDSGDSDPDTLALRKFNEMVRDDPAVEVVMLTVRDGMSLIHRRSASAPTA